MTQATMTSLLVGAHFRPPAKALLTALPAGTPLELDPEPDNPYDGDAIAVLVTIEALEKAIPGGVDSPALSEALASQGYDPGDILGQPRWQLGYIAASGNKALRGRGDLASNQQFLGVMSASPSWTAKLSWGPNGEPQVELTLEEDSL